MLDANPVFAPFERDNAHTAVLHQADLAIVQEYQPSYRAFEHKLGRSLLYLVHPHDRPVSGADADHVSGVWKHDDPLQVIQIFVDPKNLSYPTPFA